MSNIDFSALKKSRTASLEKLNGQLDKMASKSYADPNADKIWKPTRDKAGNGFAIIRFLSAPKDEEMPFVRIWDHGFQGPTGQWYIENSLTTIGLDDPVSEYNGKLWNSGVESDKEIARKQKRRLKFTSNILVVSDPANPENNGKVFLYAYGKKIFDKLNDLMNPTFEDEKAVNPFCLFDGATFRLKIRIFENYPNYDKSEFDSPTPVADTDEEMERIWGECHGLQTLLDPTNFKTYAELKTKLYRVLDISAKTDNGMTASAAEEKDNDLDLSSMKSASAPESSASTAESKEIESEDEDDDLAIFKQLAGKG